MRQTMIWLLTAAATLTLVLPADAGPNPREAKRKKMAERQLKMRVALAERAVQMADKLQLRNARNFRRQKLDGEQVAARVAKLTTLAWQKDLAAAYAEAKKTGKPILWIHALGTIDGYL